MSVVNMERPNTLEYIVFASVTHRIKRATECTSPNERSGGVGKYELVLVPVAHSRAPRAPRLMMV